MPRNTTALNLSPVYDCYLVVLEMTALTLLLVLKYNYSFCTYFCFLCYQIVSVRVIDNYLMLLFSIQ